ncbi:MAG: hypothetical protein Q9M37_06090 [Desulfonauticus sp.]|nr:hypothetical protein [Desulfonauticus sp.]
MKKIFLNLLILGMGLFFACTPKPTPPLTKSSLWNKFIQHQQQLNQISYFYLKGSAHVKKANQNHRVIYTCFGQIKGILRVDISSSLGQILSMWQVDTKKLLAFFPYENKAFISDNPNLNLSNWGYPLPFDLKMSINLLLAKINLDKLPEINLKIKSNQNIFTLKNKKIVLYTNGLIKNIYFKNYKISYLAYELNTKYIYPKRICIFDKDKLILKIFQKELKTKIKFQKLNIILPKKTIIFKM